MSRPAGAEINSMPSIVRGGAVTVAAPSSKRLALAALSLRALAFTLSMLSLKKIPSTALSL